MYRIFLSIVVVLTGLWGCTTPQPLAPQPQYSMSQAEVPISILYVPIHLTNEALTSLIQQTLTDLDLRQFKGQQDGLNWSAALAGKVGIQLKGQEIRSRIPLQIQVEKDFGISSVSATGELSLNLRTLYHIRPDWTVQTYTNLEDHTWVKKPVARVAGVQVSIGGLTDLVLKSSKQQLTRQLDTEIQKALDLRVLLTPLWTALKRPRLISETMQLWFRFEPQVVGIEPFIERDGALESAVHIEGLTRLKAGSEPSLKDPDGMPRYATLENHEDSVHLLIHTEIPYSEAELMAEEQLIGKTFSSGSRKVTVEGVDLYGQANYMIASVRLAGSYKGQVHLRGKPVMNVASNAIELEDMDFDVQTRNVLHRSAAWLFKGNIRSSLEQALRFPLEDNLGQVRQEINDQLNHLPVGPWIRLTTPGLNLSVHEINLTQDGIAVNLLLSGRVEVKLTGLN